MEKHPAFESKEMENWFNLFFLDPITHYLDETVFRIDLYDSDEYFIVEAMLPSVAKEDIYISVKENELEIKIIQFPADKQQANIKTRTVYFPIDISGRQMKAKYVQNNLEIWIYKD